MMCIPGYGWYVILGLFHTKTKTSLGISILQLVWEVGKGSSERKKVILVYEFKHGKPGKYDHNINLFYNITTYAAIFNVVIIFLFGQCM